MDSTAGDRYNLERFASINRSIDGLVPDEIAQRLDQVWRSLSHRLLEVIVADA